MTRETRIAAKVMVAATFAQFEQALRQHDWTYSYSDDGAVWRGGEASSKRIEEMAKELVLVDPERTVALYNKYGRAGWGGDWKDVGPDRWMDLHRHEAAMKAYQKTLELEIRKFGRQLGQVVAGRWKDTGWVNAPPSYTLLIRRPDGAEWSIVLSGWNGGTHVGLWNPTLVSQESVSEYYSVLDGLSPTVLSQTLEKMYKDLVRRGVI